MIFGLLSGDALMILSPNVLFMMSTIMSCCCTLQCTSAEMTTGYGEVTKAYLLMASQMSLTGTFEVSVLP